MSQTAKQIRQAVEKDQANFESEETTFFGQQVWVFQLSSYEMEAWRREYCNNKDPKQKRKGVAKIVQLSIRTEDGGYIYPAAAVDQIAGFKAKELDKIEEIIWRINGYTPAGLADIVKNLLKTPGVDGAPDLPESTDAASQNSTPGTPPTSSESS